MEFPIIRHLILAGFFIFLLWLGKKSKKTAQTSADYYAVKNKLNYWIAAFSSRATGESAWLLLGLTGMGAMIGFKALWIVVGESLGVAIAWCFMARPFKKKINETGAITIPEYLSKSINDKSLLIQKTAAAILVFFLIVYISAQIDATGKAFSQFLHWDYFFGLDKGYWLGAITGFLIVAIYTGTGGLQAVAWSDLLQGSLMLIGLIFLPFSLFIIAEDPWLAAAYQPDMLEFIPSEINLAAILTVLSFVAIGLGYMGAPQVFVRFIAIKNQEEVSKGAIVAILFTILASSGAVFTGIFGRALLAPDQGSLTDASQAFFAASGETVLPLAINTFFPEIITGLFAAAVISAIMSTVDSLLLVASSSLSYDLRLLEAKRLQSLSHNTKMTLFTWTIAGLALGLAILVAIISPDRTVFWFVIFGWSGITAVFCPTMLLSLFMKGFNTRGAFSSMATGFSSVIFFKFLAPLLGDSWQIIEPLGELLPSYILALAAGLLGSKSFSQK
jgi:sodium/proline symporter